MPSSTFSLNLPSQKNFDSFCLRDPNANAENYIPFHLDFCSNVCNVNIGLLKELRIYHFGLPFHATAYKGNTIANDI